MIITIGRQHGSNGLEIARRLAKDLNIKCYDKEIVNEAASKSNISKDVLIEFDERRGNAFLLEKTSGGFSRISGTGKSLENARFEAVKALAEEGDCIFVGRCADYILKDRADLVRVFIRGDLETRVQCIMKTKGVDEANARRTIREVDKERGSFYKYNTDYNWGDADHYDICINSSMLGIDGSVAVLKAFIDNSAQAKILNE